MEKAPLNFIVPCMVVSGVALFVLITIPQIHPLIEWGKIIVAIVLEVGGIGLFLDWLMRYRLEQRLSRQRQITLHLIFRTLHDNLIKPMKDIDLLQIIKTSPEEVQESFLVATRGRLETHEKLLPQEKLVMYYSTLFRLAATTERAMNRLDRLLDHITELFDQRFVTELLEISNLGVQFADQIISNKLTRDNLSILSGILKKRFQEDFQRELVDVFVEGIISIALPLSAPDMQKIIQNLVAKSKSFIKDEIWPKSEPQLRKILQKTLPYTHWSKT